MHECCFVWFWPVDPISPVAGRREDRADRYLHMQEKPIVWLHQTTAISQYTCCQPCPAKDNCVGVSCKGAGAGRVRKTGKTWLYIASQLKGGRGIRVTKLLQILNSLFLLKK